MHIGTHDLHLASVLFLLQDFIPIDPTKAVVRLQKHHESVNPPLPPTHTQITALLPTYNC